MTVAAIIFRGSSPVPLVFWSGFGFVAGITLFIYGFRLLQRRRLILDTPFSKIRSASLGIVEISGLAAGPYTMIAPITARPCYYFQTLVWEWKQQGKNKQWVKVAGECMHVPFFVDDNTGRMLIDPRGAELDLHRDFEQEFCDSFFTTKETVPDNVRAFLARHGVGTSNKIKVQEFCIKPKNSLFILGTIAENRGIEVTPTPIQDSEAVRVIGNSHFSVSVSFGAGPSVSSPLRPFFQGAKISPEVPLRQGMPVASYSGAATATALEMTQHQRIAAALTKAGISNPGAWAAAGIPATGVAVAAAASAEATSDQQGTSVDGFDPHPPVVLMKGMNNKTFLISWRSQREVVRALGWKSALMIWGGPALALLSLYVFLSIEKLL
jgi:hypothetical protein